MAPRQDSGARLSIICPDFMLLCALEKRETILNSLPCLQDAEAPSLLAKQVAAGLNQFLPQLWPLPSPEQGPGG